MEINILPKKTHPIFIALSMSTPFLNPKNNPVMKYLLLILFFITISAQSAFSTVHVVNNNGAGNFTTAQDASDNAAAGDTLYLVPSPTAYTLSVMDKRLVVIGSGYFLSSNGILVNGVGTDNSQLTFAGNILASADGIKFIGLEIAMQSRQVAAQKVTFVRCRMSSYLYPNVNGVEVVAESCWIDYLHPTSGRTFKVTVNNSYIWDVYGAHSSVVRNNVIGNVASFSNSSLFNNVFLTTGASNLSSHWVSSNNNTVSYNFYVIGTPTGDVGNNNTFSAATTSLFISASGQPTDGVYRLRTGSPGRGAGLNGVDVGMFGGPTPYIQAGQPPVPFLTNIKLDQVVSQESGMNFSVTFQSRN